MWNVDANGLILRSNALDAGYTDADIKNAVRSGEIVVVSRGKYAQAADLPEVSWERDQELFRRRSLSAATSDAPLSHQSAAVVHGLALLKPDMRRVHVSVPRASSGKRRSTRHIHAGLDESDVVIVDGTPVTGLATTAVDVAVATDFPRALAALDSALRMGVSHAELERVLARRRRRGSVRVRQALRHASRAAANPGESWSRAQIIQAGLPMPLLQQEVQVRGRVYYSDFELDRLVIGEFDGQGKYLNNRRPGERIADAVMREKERENALRDLGFDVVRWDWPVLEAVGVLDRVAPHLKRAGLL